MLFQPFVTAPSQAEVCGGAMAWPRMLLCNLKLTEHRRWFFLESAGCSSFAHFSYIKKRIPPKGMAFFFFSLDLRLLLNVS